MFKVAMLDPMKPSHSQTVTISSRVSDFRVPRRKILSLVDHLARAEKLSLGQVDIAVVGAREMAKINRQFLSHAGSTDVISFDLSDPGGPLDAQIIVCSDVARREAHRRRLAVTHELLRYVAHGLLHLSGYDDATPEQARQMHERQEMLLEAFWQSA